MASFVAIPPPPPPEASQPDNSGRYLLDLLRSRDKLVRTLESDNTSESKWGSDPSDGELLKQEVRRSAVRYGEPNPLDGEIDTIEHELLQRLHSLDVIIRRRGLFNNDSERALSFYNSASERSSSSAAAAKNNHDDAGEKGVKASTSSSNSNKRKRKGDHGSGGGGNSNATGGGLSAASYGIFLDSHSNNTQFSTTPGSGGDASNLDEGLILTVVCRILGVTVGRRKKNKKNDQQQTSDGQDDDDNDDEMGAFKTSRQTSTDLIRVALSIIVSICNHAKDGMVSSLDIDSQCAFVEGDMMGSIGSSLLDALRDSLLSYYYYHQSGINEEKLTMMIDSLRAATSVITLLEMRLSRSEKIIKGLRETTWLVLDNIHSLTDDTTTLHAIQQAATILLASLPLVGNADGSPPSKIWSQYIKDGILLLRWAIDGFFPMPTLDNSDVKDESTTKYPALWKDHQRWLSIGTNSQVDGLDLDNDPTDSYRARALQVRIQYLTNYIVSLVKMEGYPLHRTNSFSSSALLLPFDSLLDISELLLSFPLAAESKNRSTKQRLRSTPVDGGLISPDAAMNISVELRLCGHTLFDVAIESCRGGSGALGRGRRIVAMTVANLQSSCSMALVASVDGKRGGDYKRQRVGWLRGSIPLRIKAIQMFHNVALSLGSSSMSSTGTAKSMSKALVLIGGCLLEQTHKGEDNDKDCEWGTLGEKAKLVEISSSSLASCLAAFGGLIPINIRSTIDSILYSCLTKLYSNGCSSIFAYAEAKRSILHFSTVCVTVPWGDGGRSSTNEIVRKVSLMLKHDPDITVASMALSTLCVVDSFMTPRAPAILIATRTQDSKNDITASEMLRSINEKSKEIQASSSTKGTKKKASKQTATKSAASKRVDTMDDGLALKSKKSKITESVSTVKEPAKSNGLSVVKNMVINRDDGKVDDSAATNHVGSSEVMEVDESLEDKRHVDKDKAAIEKVNEGKEDLTSQNKRHSDKDDAGDNEDDFSLDDFPEIVDEDPDEGDRM